MHRSFHLVRKALFAFLLVDIKHFGKDSMLRPLTVTLLATVCSVTLLASDYTLPATPSTVAWGYYSGSSKPVLTAHSGETVRMQTLPPSVPPTPLIPPRLQPKPITPL